MSGNEVVTPTNTASLTENHLKQDQIKAGAMGKIFGSNEHVGTYVAASISVITILCGLAITVFAPVDSLGMDKKELWAILSPILTACLGYVFGKGK